MRKLINKLSIAVLGVACLAAAQGVSAQSYCANDPCCRPSWSSCFDFCDTDIFVGVDVLVWRTLGCPQTAGRRVVQSANEILHDSLEVQREYYWGVRPYVSFERDCVGFRVSYLWYEANDGHSFKDSILDLQPVGDDQNNVSGIRATFHHTLQNVDARLTQYCVNCGCLSLNWFFNARWAYHRLREKSKVLAPEVEALSTERVLRYQAGGFGVGTGAQFCICDGLGFFAHVNPMILIGVQEQKLSSLARTTGQRTNVIFRDDTRIIPALDTRIGFNYVFDCACTRVIFDLGYELNYFWELLPSQPGAFTQNVRQNCDNLGFAGIFFGGRILF